MFKKLLRKENTKYYKNVREDLWSIKESALDMALYFLNLMGKNDLADALQGKRSAKKNTIYDFCTLLKYAQI